MTDELAVLNPDRKRAARVVSQCRERLERRTRPQLAKGVILERAVIGGFALVYLGLMVSIVLGIPALG